MLRLSFPAAPKNFVVLRATASATGARAGLTLDQLDDLRSAVEEAAALLTDAGANEVHVTLDPDQQPFTVTLSAVTQTPVVVKEASFPWLILNALCDKMSVTSSDETTFTLTFAGVTLKQ